MSFKVGMFESQNLQHVAEYLLNHWYWLTTVSNPPSDVLRYGKNHIHCIFNEMALWRNFESLLQNWIISQAQTMNVFINYYFIKMMKSGTFPSKCGSWSMGFLYKRQQSSTGTKRCVFVSFLKSLLYCGKNKAQQIKFKTFREICRNREIGDCVLSTLSITWHLSIHMLHTPPCVSVSVMFATDLLRYYAVNILVCADLFS